MEWTKYTTKEALKDNDELMILDTDGKANKRTLMDKIWNYVVDKMTTAVIAKLGTTNKTLIGAVNELNSNKICSKQIYSSGIYKDCNDLPVGESAIAFRTALHKPKNDDSIWFIFCMGSPSDGIKYQVAIQYLYTLVVKTRTWNSTDEVWNDWK